MCHFFRCWLLALPAVLLIGDVAGAQVAAQPAQRFQGVSGYRSPSYSENLQWLYSQQIQDEVELIADQKEKINSIRTEYYEKMRDLYKGLEGLDAKERQEKYYQLHDELVKDVDKRILDVLLPHQIKRLKQVALQMRMLGDGTSARTLLGDELTKSLDISEAQKQELLKKQQEVQERLQKDMEKLREDARQELLNVLTPEQKRKLEELLGEKYDYQRTWASGFGVPPGGGGGGANIQPVIPRNNK